jgi:hypothetical protein
MSTVLRWVLRTVLGKLLTFLPIIALLAAIFGASGEAYFALTDIRRMIESPQPGPAYHAPSWRWVRVMNPDGVDTPEQHMGFREQCLARYRSELQAIGYSLIKGTLVTLRNPEDRPAAGVLCPDGTVFFASDTDLTRWEAAYRQRAAQEEDLAKFAEAALNEPLWGARSTVARWDWVEVMNPDGIDAFGYDVEFLETCGIEAGGMVRIIGQHPDFGTLAYYTADPGLTPQGIGIPCPTGTLFVLESDRTFRNGAANAKPESPSAPAVARNGTPPGTRSARGAL